MKKHLLLFWVLLLCSSLLALAQAPAGRSKITGIVLDSTDRQPVAFATISLISLESQKPISGAVADDKGQFAIAKVAAGKYKVSVSFIGYRSVNREITVEDKGEVTLGTVLLPPAVKELDEVTVEGKKDLIEERVDRTIYNAEQDATTRGGDASDVLRRVPALTVDLDGNVSLRGNQNIRVLINNKPSTILATSIADALKQIPADQIKSVEVITSPSARYDAEGSAGIINIITKKNTLEGLTLGVDMGVGYRGSNLGLNGSYRKGKIGLSLGGFGRAEYNVQGNFENRQRTISTTGSELLTVQSADTRSAGMRGRYTLGFDYDINKFNSLTASVQFGLRNNNNYQDGLLAQTFQNNALLSRGLRDVNVKDLSNNVDVSLTYTRTYAKPQRELNVLALFSRNDRNNDFTNSVLNADTRAVINRLKNINASLNQESTIQLDYQTPLGKTQMLEFGAKQIMRQVTSNFQYFFANGATGDYVLNPNAQLSNALNYDQNVTAAYTSYTATSKTNYSLKVGVRYEYTDIKASLQNEQRINIPAYGALVPSINLSKKFKKGDIIKLSYNRRLQRPSIQFLNPNIQAANPLNITIGNPSLDPEFTNNLELGYSTYIKGVAINVTSFARNTNNAIQSVRDIQGRDTIRTTFQNIGREDAYGFNVSLNINVGKFNIGTGGDVYYAVLNNNVSNPLYAASNEGWVYNFRLFGGYSFGNGWGLQSFSFYRGRAVQLQGIQGGFGTYSLGLRKDFKNKKGSIGAGLENFFSFNGITIRNELVSPVINQQSVNVNQNFSFRINFSYRIGKMSFDSQPRRRKSINNDDLKDGGGDGGGGNGGNNEGGGGGGRPQMQGGGGRPGGQGAPPAGTAPAGGQKPGAKPGEKPAGTPTGKPGGSGN